MTCAGQPRTCADLSGNERAIDGCGIVGTRTGVTTFPYKPRFDRRTSRGSHPFSRFFRSKGHGPRTRSFVIPGVRLNALVAILFA